jgi:glycosyltransferase involved in cell wall biosynthesis
MITYLINDVKKSLTFEELFLALKNAGIGFKVLLILNEANSPLFQFCKAHKIACTELVAHGKRKRFLAIYKFLKKNPSKIVHTHLFEAGLIGGFVSWLLRIPKRVYTRHHGDQHIYEAPHALKYDKLINFFHTDIICLSKTHLKQIKKFENPKAKLHLVPHAYNKHSLISTTEKTQEIKDKYLIDLNQFNIMVNARWTETKGVQDIIEAFRIFIKTHENSKLWLFHASGDYKKEIENNLNVLPKNSFQSILFEEEIISVYPLMDVFVHVPQRATYESFGQVYIEAMGTGTASIFSLSGIAEDVIIPNENALQVPFNSPEKIHDALLLLKTDSQLTLKLQNNAKKIMSQFLMDDHINKIRHIYNDTF